MFTYILNSSNILAGRKGTVGHHIVIAVAQEVTEENIQKVADRVKTEFGVTLNPNNGSTSDPNIFLHIEDVDVLD